MCVAVVLVLGYLCFAVALPVAVITGTSEDGWNALVVVLFIGGYLALFPLILIILITKTINMVRRRHVAVTRRGVFFDETDEPGGQTLARRQVFSMDSIQECRVNEYGCIHPMYNLVILVKLPGWFSPVVSHSIEGIDNGQEFVNLVLAIKELLPSTDALPEHAPDIFISVAAKPVDML